MSHVHASPAQVVKVPEFRGRLSTRPLYIYLPPGYADHPAQRYPVLYMHDGQNCFEAFAADSYVGSWRADEIATRLIHRGEMRPCLIVGVANGGAERLLEYLPNYVAYQPPTPVPGADRPHRGGRPRKVEPLLVRGKADQTVAYYRDDVAAYVRAHYRVLEGREHTATCGSSMGGLFSAYIAWEHPEFARHHAIMSPSFWITNTRPGNPSGPFETIERFRRDAPRDVRIWLDSGTHSSGGSGNDGMLVTQQARDALRANGYVEGVDFCYYLHEGGSHHESSWSARLDDVFRFLFPLSTGRD